jgi:hypothetical protein
MIVKVVVPDDIYARVYFARGEQGPQGQTGATGVQGPTGPTGAAGANGSNGVGYTGVTSTSTITLGAGLKTWTVANVGAFLPGMRIRAIHSDTPSYWMEGPANVATGTTIIITVDKFNGSGSHNNWNFAIAGEIGATGSTGATGPTGPTGVVTATAPITYDSGTQTVAINQAGLTLAQSQITGLVSVLDSKTARPIPPTGNWIGNGSRNANSGDQTNTNGNLVISAFAIGTTRTLDAVAVLIGTSGTGSAGAVGRIGIWSADSNFAPSTLVRDCGTVALTGTAGSVAQISGLAQSLSPGVYWIGCVLQGAPATVPFMVTSIVNFNPINYSFQNNVATATSAEFNGNNTYRASAVTGTFAATPPTFTYNSASVSPIKVIWRFTA